MNVFLRNATKSAFERLITQSVRVAIRNDICREFKGESINMQESMGF